MPIPTPSDRKPRTVAVLADKLDRPAAFPRLVVPVERPTERLLFSTRELLLTSSGDLAAMSPGQQSRFGYQRWRMETEMRNKGQCPTFAAVTEFQAERAETDGLPPAPLPASAGKPRRRAPAPA